MDLRILLAIAAVALLATPLAAANTATFHVDNRTPSHTWTLYVPRAGDVRLHLAIQGAYMGFTMSGPGACSSRSLGSGAATTMTDFDVDCGVVPLGWYNLSVAVGDGVASGSIRSDNSTILT